MTENESESLSLRMKEIYMPNPKSSELALLTLERVQKLDLLIHLISNLNSSLVISGPSGIGKTTLLAELIKCNEGSFPILTISASTELSFDKFYDQLIVLLKNQLDYQVENNDVSPVLLALNKKKRRIVILVDNAAQLAGGLMSHFIQYAEENPCLRFVFSLTPADVLVKSKTDTAISSCHVIDVPSLSKKQCSTFLKNLLAQPDTALSYNEPLAENIYRDTQGIPGKVISEVAKGVNYSIANTSYSKWLGLGLAAVVLTTTIGFFVGGDNNAVDRPESSPDRLALNHKKGNGFEKDNSQYKRIPVTAPPKFRIASGLVSENRENRENREIILSSNKAFAGKNPMASLIEKKVEHKNSFQPKETKEKIAISEKQENIAIAKKVAEAVDNDKVKKKEKIAKAFVEKKDETQEKPVKKIKSVQKGVKEKQTNVAKWLLKQPKQYFTMQVASLSTQKSVLAFLKKHSSLKDKLKYLKVGSLDKKRYIVLYGSFKNSALALKAKKTLPPEFKKSWVRRFGSLQKMVKK